MSNKHDLPLRLRMACDKIRRTSMPIKDLVPMMHEAADAIQRLEAENEALKKDAQRLDAIERNARCDPKMCGNHVWWPTTWKHQLTGPTLRDAIDAAMTKGEA